MTDTVVTLRPNGLISAGSGWTLVGAASMNAALSDDSDSTYIQQDFGANPGATNGPRINFGTFSIPALAQVRGLRARSRAQIPVSGGNPNALVVYLTDGSTGEILNNSQQSWTPSDGSTQQYSNLIDNQYWTTGTPRLFSQTDVDNVAMYFQGVVWSGTLKVFEAYVDLYYNQAPVVSGVTVTPSGTNTLTSTPVISWTYSDPEGDPQQLYRVRIFTAAQYGIGGFDPAISPSTYDTGDVTSSATAHTVATPLPNNTTYKAYVFVADAGSNLGGSGYRFGTPAVSSTFTLQLDVPAIPVVTVTADDADHRVLVIVQGRDNMLTKNQASLETDTSGWTNYNAADVTRTTSQALDGAASMQITCNVISDMLVYTGGSAGDRTTIQPFNAYTVLAYTKAATTPRPTSVGIRWYDFGGSFISDVFSPSIISNNTSGWTETPVFTAFPPSNASFAAAIVKVGNGSSIPVGEVHYVDNISFLPGPVNFLGLSQSTMESSISGLLSGSCTLAQSTDQAYQGTHSVALTSTSTVAMAVSTGAGVSGYAVTPSTVYSLFAAVRAATVGRPVSAYVYWYDSGGALITNTASASSTDKTTGWVTLNETFTSPVNAAYAQLVVQVNSTATGEIHYVDTMAFMSGSNTYWVPAPKWTRGGFIVPDIQRLEIQRSTDGITWSDVKRMQPTPLQSVDAATGFLVPYPYTQTGGFYDYEAPRGTPVYYRARANVNDGGNMLTSEWGIPTSATRAVGCVRLVDSLVPSLSMDLCLADWEFQSESDEPQTVHYAFGRSDPVITYGVPLFEKFDSLKLTFNDDADYKSFLTLRALGRALLLQLPYYDGTSGGGAEQYWIKLGDMKPTRLTTDDMGVNQRRMVEINAHAVAEP